MANGLGHVNSEHIDGVARWLGKPRMRYSIVPEVVLKVKQELESDIRKLQDQRPRMFSIELEAGVELQKIKRL